MYQTDSCKQITVNDVLQSISMLEEIHIVTVYCTSWKDLFLWNISRIRENRKIVFSTKWSVCNFKQIGDPILPILWNANFTLWRTMTHMDSVRQNVLLVASVIFASWMRIRKAKCLSLLDNPQGSRGRIFYRLSRASCKKLKLLASTRALLQSQDYSSQVRRWV